MAPKPAGSRLLRQQYTSEKHIKRLATQEVMHTLKSKKEPKGKIQQTKLIRQHYECSQESEKAPQR